MEALLLVGVFVCASSSVTCGMGGVPVSSIHMQIQLKRSMHKAMSILDYVGSARMIRKLDHIGVIHDLTQICLTSRIGHHGRLHVACWYRGDA